MVGSTTTLNTLRMIFVVTHHIHVPKLGGPVILPGYLYYNSSRLHSPYCGMFLFHIILVVLVPNNNNNFLKIILTDQRSLTYIDNLITY